MRAVCYAVILTVVCAPAWAQAPPTPKPECFPADDGLAVGIAKAAQPGEWIVFPVADDAIVEPMLLEGGRFCWFKGKPGKYRVFYKQAAPPGSPWTQSMVTLGGAKPPPPPVPPKPAPKINSFTVAPSDPQPKGAKLVLKWAGTGEATAKIGGQPVAWPVGTMDIAPDKTTTYELTVVNTGGTAKQPLLVTVLDLPPPPPVTVDGLMVFCVENKKDRGKLVTDAPDQMVALDSQVLRDYMDANCAKGPDGRPAWRFVSLNEDGTLDVSQLPELFKQAAAVPHPNIPTPYWLVTNGKAGEVSAFPPNVDAALTLLKKYTPTK